jgi:hypothetical protein
MTLAATIRAYTVIVIVVIAPTVASAAAAAAVPAIHDFPVINSLLSF